MVWIIFAAVLLFCFTLLLRSETAKKIGSQGGMLIKYNILINYLTFEGSKIIYNTNTAVIIEARAQNVVTTYQIIQAFDLLSIEWKMNSVFTGVHKLKWNFNENVNQHEMIRIIENDLAKYVANLGGLI